jgi:hypothetical protein
MFPGILLLAMLAAGVNYGWEPLPEGGMKYILQFKLAELEEAQKSGDDIESNIPLEAGNVRAISIRLGTGELPKKASTESKPLVAPSSAVEPAKPWWLIGISLGLFASLAANVYLLWIFAGLRKRYRNLLAK